MTFQGNNIYTAKDGQWRVACVLLDGKLVITDPNKYASEASATIAAKRAHFEKPFMNFSAVRA